MKRTRAEPSVGTVRAARGKKRYVRPELVRYGSLLKLTQSTGGTRPGDAGNMMI